MPAQRPLLGLAVGRADRPQVRPPPETEPTGPSERGPLDAAPPKPSGARVSQPPQPAAGEPKERGILEVPKKSEAKP